MASQTRLTQASGISARTRASAVTDANRSVLTGRVTFENNSPAAGTKVTLCGYGVRASGQGYDSLPELASTTTDEQGNYRVEYAMPRTGVIVEARKPGYGTSCIGLTPSGINSSAPTVSQDKSNLVLKPAIPVEGLVVDSSGRSVAGATIRSRPTNRQMGGQSFAGQNAVTTSSADGRFAINEFSFPELAVVVTAEGHGFASVKTKAPDPNLKIVLPDTGATIAGTVLRKETNEPIAGAVVRMTQASDDVALQFLRSGMSTVSDAVGQYHIGPLPAGKYYVSGETPELRTFSPKSTRGKDLRIAGTETSSGQDLFLYGGYSVSGIVTDRKSGKPVSDVKIGPMRWDNVSSQSEIITTTDGKFRIEKLFGGDNSRAYLSASRDGYAVVSNRDSRNIANTVEIPLPPDTFEITRDIELLPFVTVSGVVQTEEGMPVSNATVGVAGNTMFMGPNNSMYVVNDQEKPNAGEKKRSVDSTGAFELPVQPLARLTLRADSPDFPSAETNIDVGDDSLTGTKIVMKAGAQIKGTVVSRDGSGIANSTVQVIRDLADQYGQYYFDYQFNFPGSKPLATANSDANGAFSIKMIPPGKIALVAKASGYIAGRPMRMKLDSGETTGGVRLVLQNGHYIAGLVSDENNQPLANAQVSFFSYGGGTGQQDSGSTQTDNAGHYRLENVPDRQLMLIAQTQGYSQSEKRDVGIDKDDVNFTLKKQQYVTFVGTVLEANTETPITDFEITGGGGAPYLYGASGTKASDAEMVPDQPGKFKIAGLAIGDQVQIAIKAPHYISTQERIVVTAGKDPVEQTFHLVHASTITGRVIDQATRQPIPNVPITLIGLGNQNRYYSNSERTQEQQSTTSGNDGRFELDGGAAGNNTVQFSPSEPYSALYLDVAVETGKSADMGDVPLGSGGVILGHLVRMPGESPVSGQRISLNANRSGIVKSATSAGDGSFEFKNLPNDMYSITAGENSTVRVMVEASDKKEVTIRLGAVTLKGLVTHAGNPVAAQLQFQQGTYGQTIQRSVATNDDGQFELANLSPGKWNVAINSQEHGYKTDTVELPESGTVEKTFILPSGKIVGVVLDPEGKPVQGASVTAKGNAIRSGAWNEVLPGDYSSRSRVESKEDGSFEMTNFDAGRYMVIAEKQRIGKAKVDGVEVPLEGQSDKVTLTLQPLQTGTLVSVALNMTTGGPIKEAWCILWSGTEKLSNNATRGDDGIMTIPDIPAGDYRVQVSSFGFAVSERNITIEAGKTLKIEDVLYEAGAVRFSVQDKNGAPIAGATCMLLPDDPKSIEQPRRGATDQSGLWVVRGLYPGNYSATAMLSGKSPGKGSTTVVAHQPVDLVIKLE